MSVGRARRSSCEFSQSDVHPGERPWRRPPLTISSGSSSHAAEVRGGLSPRPSGHQGKRHAHGSVSGAGAGKIGRVWRGEPRPRSAARGCTATVLARCRPCPSVSAFSVGIERGGLCGLTLSCRHVGEKFYSAAVVAERVRLRRGRRRIAEHAGDVGGAVRPALRVQRASRGPTDRPGSGVSQFAACFARRVRPPLRSSRAKAGYEQRLGATPCLNPWRLCKPVANRDASGAACNVHQTSALRQTCEMRCRCRAIRRIRRFCAPSRQVGRSGNIVVARCNGCARPAARSGLRVLPARSARGRGRGAPPPPPPAGHPTGAAANRVPCPSDRGPIISASARVDGAEQGSVHGRRTRETAARASAVRGHVHFAWGQAQVPVRMRHEVARHAEHRVVASADRARETAVAHMRPITRAVFFFADPAGQR
jgi:hypothetical protein